MKLFRNYDRKHSGFGETSVSALTPNVDRVSAFGALRSYDNALTIAVVNKQLHEPAPIDLRLAHFAASGSIEIITLADGKPHAKFPIRYSAGTIQLVLPPQSVTMLVLHADSH